MSKRRHRSRESNNMGSNQNYAGNSNNRFPFGINPQQLLSMLGGNFDMNKLGNMLNSMNMNGFDLNSMNQQMNWMNNSNTQPNTNNSNNNFNFESMMNAMNGNNTSGTNMNTNNEKVYEKNDDIDIDEIDDENIQILMSLRRIVDPSKVQFVDRIIELYNNGAFKEE